MICLLIGATIGWFIMAAPLIGLVTTAVVLRPALELTRDGLVQRQYPYSSLTRWDVIDGGRHRQGGEPRDPRVQARSRRPSAPSSACADLLLAVKPPMTEAGSPIRLPGGPDEALEVVNRYLKDPELRAMLPGDASLTERH